MRPALWKYSVATLEPGASDVFTHGLVLRPSATAFLARRPAASITLGLLVFVQLVMAAMTTAPSCSSKSAPLYATCCAVPMPVAACCAATASAYFALLSVSGTRSCGRFGPARLGTTVLRSSSSVSVKTGSGVSSVRKSPCALV